MLTIRSVDILYTLCAGSCVAAPGRVGGESVWGSWLGSISSKYLGALNYGADFSACGSNYELRSGFTLGYNGVRPGYRQNACGFGIGNAADSAPKSMWNSTI